MAPSYRIRIDLTYSSTGNATTALTSINNVLIAQSRPERAVQTNAQIALLIEGLTEAQGKRLRDLLTPAWGVTARSGGKVSVVRRP